MWGYWWIWISILLLVLTIVEMGGVARPYYQSLKDAIQLRPSGVPRKSDEELESSAIAARALQRRLGDRGLLVITWLMVYKPLWRV